MQDAECPWALKGKCPETCSSCIEPALHQSTVRLLKFHRWLYSTGCYALDDPYVDIILVTA